MSYTSALYCAAVPSLADRQERLARKFLKSVLDPSSCLFILLPTPRDPSITTRLRCANKFPRIPMRTRKYQTLSPTLCPITNLHIDKLCLLLSYCIDSMRSIWTFGMHLLLFCGLLLSCSAVLLGFATTRLNKTATTVYYHFKFTNLHCTGSCSYL